jgi:hypothetical protein
MPVNVCLFASDIYDLQVYKGTKKDLQQWSFIASDIPGKSMQVKIYFDNPGMAVKL